MSRIDAEDTSPGMPRFVEVWLVLVGLVLFSPAMAMAAVLIALSSPGPVLFCQRRVGLHGRVFRLYKFRTMTEQDGLLITSGGDRRITACGKLLRKTKIDELPQLWNVLKGDMALVGPRPEVEHFVDIDNPLWHEVLRVRPGITDPVTLSLKNEEGILEQARGDKEEFYLNVLQPTKLNGYIEYMRVRTCWSDVKVLIATLTRLVRT
jgi:lipopolysaccharide/colanic/teichoic acid biosynthesis glycosyltransferase